MVICRRREIESDDSRIGTLRGTNRLHSRIFGENEIDGIGQYHLTLLAAFQYRFVGFGFIRFIRVKTSPSIFKYHESFADLVCGAGESFRLFDAFHRSIR